jgi:dTDP-4-amino-4,6-dideoxy-D-glucose acyltransferase
MIDDFLIQRDLEAVGFAEIGRDVQISRNAVIFNPQRICIGKLSRIDAFCILSPGDEGLSIGRNVHVSAYTSILGRGKVQIDDFCTLSVRCSIFSSNDDYTGSTLTNPSVPAELRDVSNGPVHIMRHAILGTGCVVLPNVIIGESSAVGALSLVKSHVPSFTVVAGVPAGIVGPRKSGHVDLAEKYLQSEIGRR